MLERVLAGLLVVPFLHGAAATPRDQAQVVFSFRDDDIIESSGLAVVDGLVVTTNDSGDTGRVFAVDPGTGKTVGVTEWSDDATDVEALAPDGPDAVWVGDIGDNTGSRDSVQVVHVVLDGRGDAEPEVHDLTYPDGARDAETLMRDPTTGRLYIASKGPLGGQLFEVPESGDGQLKALGDVLPLATDGAFLPDGKHVVVRNYAVAAVYAFPSLEKVEQFALPDQPQGEGLAVDADGSLLLSSEGLHSKVLRVSVPTEAPSTSASSGASTSDSPGASPSTHTESREDSELPETTETERPAWPWFLSGLIALGCLMVLSWSLRRR